MEPRAGIALAWDEDARAGFRTVICQVRGADAQRLRLHAFFTASWPSAETNLHPPDVVDLLVEEGKVSGLKLFRTTHHVECVAILEPAEKGR